MQGKTNMNLLFDLLFIKTETADSTDEI